VIRRVAAAAVLLGALASPALANGPGGPCHLYWKPSPVSGVDLPFLFCDY